MNRYYFAVASALYTVTWVILTYDGLSIPQGIKMAMLPQGILFVVSLGWRESIRRHSCQADLKMTLIEEMEDDLPSAPFTVERRLYADDNKQKPTPSSWEEVLPAFINRFVWMYAAALFILVLAETLRYFTPYWESSG
nr:hypothetical protein [Salidesulfovibrio brasiliensis]